MAVFHPPCVFTDSHVCPAADYVFRLDNDAYLRVDRFFIDMLPGLPSERVILGNYLGSNKAGPLWWNYFGPTMPAYPTGIKADPKFRSLFFGRIFHTVLLTEGKPRMGRLRFLNAKPYKMF